MLKYGPRRSRAACVALVALLALAGASRATASAICFPCSLVWGAFFLPFLPPPDDPERPTPECTNEQGLVSLQVIPLDTEMEPADTFLVNIAADIDQPIVSYGFHLFFDTSLLSLNSLEIAAPFTPLPVSDPASAAGLAYPDSAVGNNVLLATAQFTALAPGVASIGAAVTDASPVEGFAQRGCGFAELVVTPGLVTIDEPDKPIPEPSTVGLLLAGLALNRVRRRLR